MTPRPPPIELQELEAIVRHAGPRLQRRLICEVPIGDDPPLPVHAYLLGSTDPQAPAVAFVGGVHGLERIGAEVVIAHLRSVVMRLRWDATLDRQLESMRLVYVPVVNPGGLLLGTRANPNGVDLMRNSPVESAERVPWLVGGQRLSATLPWYRGPAGTPMQPESAALCALIEAELLGRPFAIAVDCHSGFGLRDRVWFPYAHTARPIEHLPEIEALCQVMDTSLPHHRYVVEPQSHQYLTHGDLWDHLYRRAPAGHVFLPLTLEMGSWLWVRKNPRQLLTRHGLFNPIVGHRQQRVLRRHVGFLDFITRAACSHLRWAPAAAGRPVAREAGMVRFYRERRR